MTLYLFNICSKIKKKKEKKKVGVDSVGGMCFEVLDRDVMTNKDAF